jgi:hypothetical protein
MQKKHLGSRSVLAAALAKPLFRQRKVKSKKLYKRNKRVKVEG